MMQKKGLIIGIMLPVLLLLLGIIIYTNWIAPHPVYPSASEWHMRFPYEMNLQLPKSRKLWINHEWAERISDELYDGTVDPNLIVGFSKGTEEEIKHFNWKIEYIIPERSTEYFSFDLDDFGFKTIHTKEDRAFNRALHQRFEKMALEHPEIFGMTWVNKSKEKP